MFSHTTAEAALNRLQLCFSSILSLPAIYIISNFSSCFALFFELLSTGQKVFVGGWDVKSYFCCLPDSLSTILNIPRMYSSIENSFCVLQKATSFGSGRKGSRGRERRQNEFQLKFVLDSLGHSGAKIFRAKLNPFGFIGASAQSYDVALIRRPICSSNHHRNHGKSLRRAINLLIRDAKLLKLANWRACHGQHEAIAVVDMFAN